MATTVLGPKQVGQDGKVRCYDIPAEEWVRKFPVDAKEQCDRGTASMTGPIVHMRGPQGDANVCACEVREYKDNGYKVVKARKPKKVEQDETPAYNFRQHAVGELRDAGTKLLIDEAPNMSKTDLIKMFDTEELRLAAIGALAPSDEDEDDDEDDDDDAGNED